MTGWSCLHNGMDAHDLGDWRARAGWRRNSRISDELEARIGLRLDLGVDIRCFNYGNQRRRGVIEALYDPQSTTLTSI